MNLTIQIMPRSGGGLPMSPDRYATPPPSVYSEQSKGKMGV